MKNYSKYICHRIPERSFFINGYQFPVCARCTGVYLAVILYVIFAHYVAIRYTWTIFILAVICVIPMAVDGLTQLFELRLSNNTLRFVTGFLGGLGLVIMFKIIKIALTQNL